ncbi:hypothetical protein B0H15DRAFT_832581 [Mycena belliarum]|uniref:Uncharacterized protein n=1 Tax=Mycena belliarum TaxID=1033014 RepID=A0AAD6XSS7_9AGAR|nr:hypothetical protein B0H15DRAFT_832581 [Mycena belliae]
MQPDTARPHRPAPQRPVCPRRSDPREFTVVVRLRLASRPRCLRLSAQTALHIPAVSRNSRPPMRRVSASVRSSPCTAARTHAARLRPSRSVWTPRSHRSGAGHRTQRCDGALLARTPASHARRPTVLDAVPAMRVPSYAQVAAAHCEAERGDGGGGGRLELRRPRPTQAKSPRVRRACRAPGLLLTTLTQLSSERRFRPGHPFPPHPAAALPYASAALDACRSQRRPFAAARAPCCARSAARA